MFVAPLILAVFTGLIIPLLSQSVGPDRAPSDSNIAEGSSTRSEVAVAVEREPDLDLLDLSVLGGEVPSFDAEGEMQEGEFQSIDITVRNVGDTVAVLTGLELVIQDHALIEFCEAGSGLEPSVQYDVEMPTDPQVGDMVPVKISQQLAPDTADRFTVRLSVPPPEEQNGMRLYLLDVLLEHDDAQRPLRAGRVVVAVPYLPSSLAFDVPPGSPPDITNCYQANRDSLQRFLSTDATKPNGLDERLLSAP